MGGREGGGQGGVRKEKHRLREKDREANWLLPDFFGCCSCSSCHFSIRREQSHLGLREDRWQEEWEAAALALGPCWRGPVLVEVTGARSCSPGAPDTTQHLPREMQHQHFLFFIFFYSIGSYNRKTGGKKLSASSHSHFSFTLSCYSSNSRVKDRQRHKILMQPDVPRTMYCYKCRGAFINSLQRYTGAEVDVWF